MAIIRPFRALRPVPEKAEQVSCVPYDVVNDAEVREFTGGNPLSFLRITRPDAELVGQDEDSPEAAFERARRNLRKLIDDGVFITETEPSLYVYRLATNGHHQTGLVACCSLDEYEKGLIKKHEETRPDKVRDRTGHLLTLRAQTGLIFLTFRGADSIHALFDRTAKSEPLYDFCGSDDIRHTMWRVADPEVWVNAFAAVPALYIADGHHRVESADRARQVLRDADPNYTGNEDYNYVVAGIFPAEDLKILAYNRVVRDLNGLTIDEFLQRLQETFIVSDAERKEPKSHGEICMYLAGKWHRLFYNVQYFREPDPIERLDVSILQDNILGPILGINDPRTDDRVAFVGGKRGTSELERMVNDREAAVAFSLFPTTMYDLLAISDMDEIMPPKSTWFEPKLKDGLLVHLI